VIGDPDRLASQIANKYQEWQSYRNKWLDTVKEIREYVFATSTKTLPLIFSSLEEQRTHSEALSDQR
jgi:hypothetical protein